ARPRAPTVKSARRTAASLDMRFAPGPSAMPAAMRTLRATARRRPRLPVHRRSGQKYSRTAQMPSKALPPAKSPWDDLATGPADEALPQVRRASGLRPRETLQIPLVAQIRANPRTQQGAL